MKVTYLQHSGFVVELDSTVLIFDYYKGRLPRYDRDQKIYVFVSHRHYDHYKRSVFDLKERYENITYILSDDIPKKNFNLESVFISPNMRYETEEIAVSTLRSTDEGVAFLVYCEGKIIYHAGDLNWWHWEEEGNVYNEMMRRNYQYEISKLKEVPIDLAFVPLDSRQEEGFGMGMDWFLKNTDAKHVLPMHFWGDFTVSERFLARESSKEYTERFVIINEEPQIIEFPDDIEEVMGEEIPGISDENAPEAAMDGEV